MRPDLFRTGVSGIILAAGSSRRMGRPKQLLRVGDRTLLDTVIGAALASRLDEVIVVLGAHAEEVLSTLDVAHRDRLRIVVNEAYASGMSTSLRRGIAACSAGSDGAAILLADQPGVESRLIDVMLDAFAQRRAPVVRPLFHGPNGESEPGHPVVLARSVWPLLDALEGDEGARILITRNPELLQTVDVQAESPRDIDTVEDYRRACDAAAVR